MPSSRQRAKSEAELQRKRFWRTAVLAGSVLVIRALARGAQEMVTISNANQPPTPTSTATLSIGELPTFQPTFTQTIVPTETLTPLPEFEEVDILPQYLQDDTSEPVKLTEHLTSMGFDEQGVQDASELIRDIFTPTLNKYSPSFFHNMKGISPYILFSSDLQLFSDKDAKWIRIGGTVIEIENSYVVLFDISQPKESLDHEIYHLFSDNMPLLKNDETIESIDTILQSITEDAGLSYKSDLSLEEISACSDVDPSGFYNCYGSWNSNEDGATIATALVNGDKHLWERIKTDDALAKKVDAIIDLYAIASNGEMDRQYFEDVAQGAQRTWTYPYKLKK